LDIEKSRIAGSRYYNLWFNNITPLTMLTAKVDESDLSTSMSGVALAFDQQPSGSTGNYTIDFGGGALGSIGGNCIFGGAIYDLETTGYNISAQQNWWGTQNGPAPGTVFASSGSMVDTSMQLTDRPAACR
jgi:hypothetical protein